MARIKLETILFFTIFLFLFTLPFQSTMAQVPAPPAPPVPAAPGATPVAPAPGAPPGTAPKTTPVTPPPPPTKCNIKVFSPVSAPLKQLKNSLSSGASVAVSGTINIIDGCNFTVNGFTYSYAAPNSYWTGSNDTDPNSNQISVSNKPVAQFISQVSEAYPLSPDVTFDDFNVLNLYSFVEKAVFAQAVLRTPPTSSSTTSGPTATTNSKSNANILSMNSIIIVCVLVINFVFNLNDVY